MRSVHDKVRREGGEEKGRGGEREGRREGGEER